MIDAARSASRPAECELSVLTPSFGYGRFLPDALASVQGQRGLALEHIVQDGGSADESVAVLEAFKGAVIWRSETDQGQSDALNRAFATARGRWVAWLNADEFYLPGGLEALVALGEQTGADVVYGDVVLVDRDGRLVRLLAQHPFSALTLRWYGVFIPSSAVVFRRASLPERPWDVRFARLLDWDLYLRLSRAGVRFAYASVPVGAFRVHEANVTAAPARAHAGEYKEMSRRYGVPPMPLRRLGRVLHGGQKVAAGAYAKEQRALVLRGTDLRWFSSEDGARSFSAFRRRCYGG